MSTRLRPASIHTDVEYLRQRLLHRARTLLFTNPRMAEECRRKALALLRQAAARRLRRLA